MGKTSERSLYIDLELTCWENVLPPTGEKNEIIQIGLVEVDNSNLSIRREKNIYVKPIHSSISEYCTNLTGIKKSDISSKGRPLNEALSTIQKEFGPNSKMCFAWGKDNDAINDACIEMMIRNPFQESMIDLGLIFRSTFDIKQNLSLPAALEFLNLKFEGKQHDALVDAKNTAILHIEMIRRAREYKQIKDA